METKHTKGEWEVRKETSFSTIKIVHKQQGFIIASIHHIDEYKANAKLIAAAPENLEDNIEWVAIHEELIKSNIIISKTLSDRIFTQIIKSNNSIKKATDNAG